MCEVACRAAERTESPLEALEVALDAMCGMQAPLLGRYFALSGLDRRRGGHGVVQFATIANMQEQVLRPQSSRGEPASPRSHARRLHRLL